MHNSASFLVKSMKNQAFMESFILELTLFSHISLLLLAMAIIFQDILEHIPRTIPLEPQPWLHLMVEVTSDPLSRINPVFTHASFFFISSFSSSCITSSEALDPYPTPLASYFQPVTRFRAPNQEELRGKVEAKTALSLLEEEGHSRELHPLLATPFSPNSKEGCLGVQDQGNGSFKLKFDV